MSLWLIFVVTAIVAVAVLFVFRTQLVFGVRIRKRRYKITPQGDLWLHIYSPRGAAQGDLPALVYYYGGGWVEGRINQFHSQAKHMAAAGMCLVLVQYRVKSREGTAPDSAVEDAFDAYSYIVERAASLNIDSERIAAGGNSAGGHLAACVSLCDAPHGIQLKRRPALLLLLNPVLDLFTASAELEFTCGEMALIDTLERKGLRKQLSPQQQSLHNAPPTYLLYGTEDPLRQQGECFLKEMQRLDRLVVYRTVKDQRHSFFNRPPYQLRVANDLLMFLQERGWLKIPETPRFLDVSGIESNAKMDR